MVLTPGRRRNHSYESVGRADVIERSTAWQPTARGRQLPSQFKQASVALTLAGAVLLLLAVFSARQDAISPSDSTQKLVVVRGGPSKTYRAEENAPGATAVAIDWEDLDLSESEDVRLHPQRSRLTMQTPPQNEEEPSARDQQENGDDELEYFDTIGTPALPLNSSQGIILCLHNGIVALGKALIRDLRCMGNRERIQVFHCLPAELSEQSRSILMSGEYGIEIIDVCSALVAEGKLSSKQAMNFRGYWIKPLALLHTDLEEVIMLDADDLPMRDPADLRSLPGYNRTGTVFFHDRMIGDRIFFNKVLPRKGHKQMLRDWIETFDYAAFGLSGAQPSPELLASAAYAQRTCHEQDSSMVLVDKRRAGKALDVLWSLATEMRFKLDFSWGDKEAFWLSFEFAHVPYFFSPWSASVVSSSPNRDMEEHPETLCGSIAQYFPVDNPSASAPELLYVNGKALMQRDHLVNTRARKRVASNLLYNLNPTHVTPPHQRSWLMSRPSPTASDTNTTAAIDGKTGNLRGRPPKKFPTECLVGLGAAPLPSLFLQRLAHRREVLQAIEDGNQDATARCAER